MTLKAALRLKMAYNTIVRRIGFDMFGGRKWHSGTYYGVIEDGYRVPKKFVADCGREITEWRRGRGDNGSRLCRGCLKARAARRDPAFGVKDEV